MRSHSPNDLPPVVRMKRLSHFRIDSRQLLVEFLVAPRGRPIQFHFHPLWPRHIIHFVHPLPVLVYQNLPEYRLYVIVGPTDDDREFSPREQIVDLDRRKKKKRNVRGRVKAGACNVHRKSWGTVEYYNYIMVSLLFVSYLSSSFVRTFAFYEAFPLFSPSLSLSLFLGKGEKEK